MHVIDQVEKTLTNPGSSWIPLFGHEFIHQIFHRAYQMTSSVDTQGHEARAGHHVLRRDRGTGGTGDGVRSVHLLGCTGHLLGERQKRERM